MAEKREDLKQSPVRGGVHQLKWIPWGPDDEGFVPIVTQNENGPCPLLALCNVLILRNLLTIPPGETVITSQRLMDLLGSCLVHCRPKDLSEVEVGNYEQNMQDAISVFPRLLTGLDVNVKFDSVSGFEFTQELSIFDLLSVPLYHGWLPDPSDQHSYQLVSPFTYNQLVEQAINDRSSDDSTKVNAAVAIGDFLEITASQLTYHGLCELNRIVRDGELCVFFRNNHFNTMLKRNNELLLLVTDFGFLNELGHVWHILSDIDDSGSFLDANFKPFSNHTQPVAQNFRESDEVPSPPVAVQEEEQEEEEEEEEEPKRKEDAVDLDAQIAMGLMAEEEEHQPVPPDTNQAPTEDSLTTRQLMEDEELAIRLHQEELFMIEQRREEETDHHRPPPTTREEYEQIALQGRRQRKRGAGSSRQDNSCSIL